MAKHIIAEQTLLNEKSVPTSEITKLAFSGFAHFTALQIRNKMVKGMDLHLNRLHKASIELFGKTVPDRLIHSYVRTAIENGPADQSLTITVYSVEGEFTTDSMDVLPKVLIRTGSPSNGPNGPLRLATVNYERPLAEIKHVGEIAKTYYLHQATRRGFDDAIFINKYGHLSEGTIWNLVFWDGETVIWPQANMLKGTMMQMIQRQLELLKIPQRSETITLERLQQLNGAAVMNSWTSGIAVSMIETKRFSQSEPLISLLQKAYNAEPCETC
ncbi:aminotransferase class IV family protein [Vibrio penaeicida]|uniref:aminotransferase class IV family protein n=1 Tax=Vibrio penaeicida TaxID=104609 RepID=UPI000CEA1277|nr:aminotransferase class IV family protein [Vibrio penaeicida]